MFIKTLEYKSDRRVYVTVPACENENLTKAIKYILNETLLLFTLQYFQIKETLICLLKMLYEYNLLI